jgi:peptidyl-prolyl cis-trans isomerase SurA
MEYNSRHILIAPQPSEDDLNRATRFLDSLRTAIVNDSIKFEEAARKHSDDVFTKGSGGYFTDATGGTRLTVDELEPGIFFRIDSMQVGAVSKPIVYRTDDGKNAARILYYKSLNEKQAKKLEKWFEEARKDVFINIDRTYDYCGILH